MKNFFLILAVILCIAQNSIEQNVVANIPSLKQPPPYYKSPQSTPYYCDKSLENIENPKITFGQRNLNACDDIDFTFHEITQNTCLHFKKIDNPISNSIGINFYLSADGKNEVTLSNKPDSPTNVSLQESVYRNTTSLAFYIGLAFGLIPEVRRFDRDIDVKVDMAKISKDYEQYYKITSESDIPYLNDTNFDFKSAMFFGSDFGFSNGKQSTYTVELYKDYQYQSSVSKSFSHNDFKHMYYYYCDGSNKPNKCKNGGYPVPNDSNKCKCPYYLDGNDCGKFFSDHYNPIYSNPDYVTEKSLKANDIEECVSVNLTNELFFLKVTSQNDKKNVSIVIEDLTFERNDCKAYKSYLEIFVRKDKGAAGMNFCRNIKTNITLPSLSNEVFFVFKALRENTSLTFSYKQV